MVYSCLVIYTVFVVLCTHALDEYPTLKINQGIIQGVYMQSTNGQKFSAFLSIPYAKPPVGQLRFEPPQPANSWNNVYNATHPHEDCVQWEEVSLTPKGSGSEDCLYLNVFTPQTNSEETKSYAVMIFIHGGGFIIGSGQLYGPNDLLDYDVIYVNINYRLGVLGFLSTGDEVVPGNNGLKDQVMAIKWVNDNIHFFGGDPKRITLFGQSAGGSSVHFHQLSPLSKGLFHYAISQSGTIFNFFAMGVKDVVVKNGITLARALGCSTENSIEMVNCLKTVDAYKFIAMDKIFMEWELEPLIPFKPVIETNHKNAFIAENPIDILKTGKHYQVPWITGITTEEGCMKAAMLYKNPQFILDLNEDFERFMPIVFQYSKINYAELRKMYFGNRNIDNLTRHQLADLLSDFMFNYVAKKAALLHLKHSNESVYFYVFGHKSSYSFSQIYGNKYPLYGTCHCDELLLQFPINVFFENRTRTQFDEEASKLINTLWTNFAKTGNPTPTTNMIVQTKWNPVKTQDLELIFLERNIHSSKNPFEYRMNFWEKYFE